MTQKKPQQQCSSTKPRLNLVKTKRLKNKRVYETGTKNGGLFKIVIPIPLSKLGKKARDFFFQRVSEKK